MCHRNTRQSIYNHCDGKLEFGAQRQGVPHLGSKYHIITFTKRMMFITRLLNFSNGTVDMCCHLQKATRILMAEPTDVCIVRVRLLDSRTASGNISRTNNGDVMSVQAVYSTDKGIYPSELRIDDEGMK